MPGVKDLIEQFRKRFKNTTLVLTFYTEGHDLLDDYSASGRKKVEEVGIDRVLSEFLELLWYPSKAYYAEDGDELSEEQQEARDLETLAQFDAYLAACKASTAECAKLGDGKKDDCPARLHRKAFNEGAATAYPLLYVTDQHGTRQRTFVHGLRFFCDKAPDVIAVEDKPKRLKAYVALVYNATNWGDSSGPANIETRKEHRVREAEEVRKELEEAAKKLAAKHKVQVSSMKFIAVLLRERDRHRTRREGLREDGLCATAYPFSQAGVEQWYEMNDDVNGDIARVHDIIDWLKGECPLLWAKYQERKLKRKEGQK